MSYQFDEIRFLNHECPDWWETIKMVPIKILDQDFGLVVPPEHIIEAFSVEEPKEADDSRSSSEGRQDAPVAKKVFDLDNFKRKNDVITNSGYSLVKFTEKYFKVKLFSNQFEYNDFQVRFIKGFLVINADKFTTENGAEVCRTFERRYMLPHYCYVGDVIEQSDIKKFPGGIRVRVMAVSKREGFKKTKGKPHCLKPPGTPFGSPKGRDQSPKKSPKGRDESPKKSPKGSDQSAKKLDKVPKGGKVSPPKPVS